jgi:hypothetical protein
MTTANSGSKFGWALPTTNTDGTSLAPGEITGFQVGIRHATDAKPAGNPTDVYPIMMPVDPVTATTDPLSESPTPLLPGAYFFSVQSLSVTNGSGPWAPETAFTLVAPPSPPSNLSIV